MEGVRYNEDVIMKILVTGAAGFIGAKVSEILIDQGHEVFGLDNLNDYYEVTLKIDRLKNLGVNSEGEIDSSVVYQGAKTFRFKKGNIADFDSLSTLFKTEKFDGVINLAAQAGVRYSIENPQSYIESNAVGFYNILECCRQNPVKHLVYASSSSVYGMNAKIPFSTEDKVDHPVSLYAATKKSNELMAHSYSHLYNIPTTGLRFFTVYGPWGRPDMAPMLFANAIKSGSPIKLFNNGEMKRDFTYIDDIANGTVQVLFAPPHDNPKRTDVKEGSKYYAIYNIGRGESLDLSNFVEILEEGMGNEAEKIMMPMQDGDVKRTWADTKALEDEVGYKPTVSLEQGLNNFTTWFKEYYK